MTREEATKAAARAIVSARDLCGDELGAARDSLEENLPGYAAPDVLAAFTVAESIWAESQREAGAVPMSAQERREVYSALR